MVTQPTQAEMDALGKQYKEYIRKLKIDWMSKNRPYSENVYEVMPPQEKAKVHQLLSQWAEYVTPFAEKWWGERGYGVKWPNDNSESMLVFKLKDPT